MKLNYPMKNNGMYILKCHDFDSIASMVLGEYLPSALQRPQALDIDYLINECFFLEIVNTHIVLGGGILGMMVFGDIELQCYNQMYQSVDLKLKEATMLLYYILNDRDNIPRKRFTKAHELGHWVCHRTYHSDDNRPYEFRSAKPLVACRDNNIERYQYKKTHERTDSDWEEWQADHFAASLLMPHDTFTYAAKTVIQNHGIRIGILTKGRNESIAREAIADVSKIFAVSKRATQIRMVQLGIIVD